MSKIHSAAIVDPRAEIDESVEIGPFCVIESDVKILSGTRLLPGVQVGRYTTIGSDNLIYGPATIGFPPQDLRFHGEITHCVIGDSNIIREFATIHRGTEHGGGLTTMGDGCLVMAYSHIAHDCHVGDNVIFANAGTLAGHVVVDDHATIGAFSAVHQFCHVGAYAYIGGFTVATQDCLPFCKTVGQRPARNYGINTIGLARKGFTEEEISRLKQAVRILFRSEGTVQDNLGALNTELGEDEHVQRIIAFIEASERGIIGR